MNIKRVLCPTCGAAAGQDCEFTIRLPIFHHARIGAAETAVYGSPDAAALATIKDPTDQSLPPEADPANVRPDRPVDRRSSSHDAYGDDL